MYITVIKSVLIYYTVCCLRLQQYTFTVHNSTHLDPLFETFLTLVLHWLSIFSSVLAFSLQSSCSIFHNYTCAECGVPYEILSAKVDVSCFGNVKGKVTD